ncbi:MULTISPECIES: hypothetical protein [Fischerella]|uniref:Uncharacterized protein n=1 Tax=Fischerella muscicola CCMEE 5323 TaxID=2019572 RepID=A0A2N6K3Q1_FISMU|nr:MULTISPECIES: hypothetical protein [Fischerella]MBD2430027.1 hypothetical protein [Fischerella sp. FACHB-380]PLZ90286.1 hypothetical protein CEN44_10995 [Fischerella muscicola CCMEE 5323]
MTYFLRLNNFNKVIALGAVFTTLFCLIPESSQAQRARWTGNSINTATFTFDLDTSVKDRDRRDNKGYFPKAIQNFNIDPGGAFTNSQICGKDPCPPARVRVTKLKTDSNGNVVGIKIGDGKTITLEELQKLFTTVNSDIDFSQDVIRYDISFFGTSSEPEMIWFVQSHDSNLINNLTSLSELNQIQGMFPRYVDIDDTDDTQVNTGGIFTISQPSPASTTPEPTSSPN